LTVVVAHTTRAVGTILTAAIYNFDHNIHVQNALALESLFNSNSGTFKTTQSRWVPVHDMHRQVAATNPPLNLADMTGNLPTILNSADYDTTTEEYLYFWITLDHSWDLGQLKFQLVWSHPATTTNFGIHYNLYALAFPDNSALNANAGSPGAVSDTGGTTNNNYITPLSAFFTVTGSLAADVPILFRLNRVPGNANDTLAVDARVLGVIIQFNADVPSGPTGPTGPRARPVLMEGQKGEDGEVGPLVPGRRGLPGATGPSGPKGRTLSGVQGDEGDIGDRGPPGRIGVAGPQGPLGPRGKALPGFTGPEGDEGPIGPQGKRGPLGPTGSQGPAGARRTVIQAAEDGDEGPRGVPGKRGADGVAGATGPRSRALFGAEGEQGDSGDIGPRGLRGLTGPVGSTGAQGPAGAKRAFLLSGNDGDDGERGPPGRRGATGAAGGGGGSVATGQTTVNFGSLPGKTDASATITGQASILGTSIVSAWVYPVATADHSIDEHLLEMLRVYAHTIVAGTGFTITALYDDTRIFRQEPISTYTSVALSRDRLGGAIKDVHNAGLMTYGLWNVAWQWV